MIPQQSQNFKYLNNLIHKIIEETRKLTFFNKRWYLGEEGGPDAAPLA